MSDFAQMSNGNYAQSDYENMAIEDIVEKNQVIDYVYENQRTKLAVPGVYAPQAVREVLGTDLDSQYSHSNLEHNDPSRWVTLEGASCTPNEVPLREGYSVYKPWVYITTDKVTDWGGWVYKESFQSAEEMPCNSWKTLCRRRKWRRVSLPQKAIDYINKLEMEMYEQSGTENTNEYPDAKQKKGYYPGKYAMKAFKGIEKGIKNIGK